MSNFSTFRTEEDYLLDEGIPYISDDYQLLFVDIQTGEHDSYDVKHCLFNDRTMLSQRTNRAFNVVANYFNRVNEGRGHTLYAPDNATLFIAVKERGAQLEFATIIEEHPTLNSVELKSFITALNDYSDNALHNAEKPLYNEKGAIL